LELKRVEHAIECCRCGEMIESEIEADPKFDSRLSLTVNEQSFIHSKFKGPLCIPCTNQLKTSYRILNGDYNVSIDQGVKL
jgi:hypothetical protein